MVRDMRHRIAIFALLSTAVLGCGGPPGAESEPAASTDQDPSADPQAPAAADDPDAPPVPIVTSQARADGLDVSIQVTVPEGLHSEAIPFTAEPLNVTLEATPERIVESDLFGTGLSMDLDGDGGTDGTFEITCAEGRLTMGGTQLAPLAPENSTRMDFSDAVHQMGEGGAWLIQYDRCDADHPITVGLSQDPIDLFHTEGPAVSVTLMEPPGRGTAAFEQASLDGEPITAQVWTARQATREADGDTRWTNLAGLHVPIPADGERHSIKLGISTGDPMWPRVVLVETRWAPDEGVRQRSERAVIRTQP